MENLKHTKGEWILNEERSEIVSENDCTRNVGIDIIAKCFVGFNYESTMEECKANAKLIASAPELLEALIMLMHPNDMNDFNFANRAREKAKNAINKATK